ncbi:hypothetical protein [Chryseobacterium taiwanense]|uniref:hypothetical protein n=1 Tax=Chryseobacterium taiwanense TaxID=363331 RepID=UPI00068BCFE4|nr:hypothetical protein [Chryseobacterium taiwanense]
MKKQILSLAIFASAVVSAQIYVPNGVVGNTVNSSNNFTGIGTNSPTEMLHIDGGNLRVSNGDLQLYISNFVMDGGNVLLRGNQDVADILFINNNNDQYARIYTNPQGTRTLHFTTQSNNEPNLTISESGNIGVGIANPQYKLDVIGKASFSDNVKVDAKFESKEIKVTLTPTADFVFEENYDLPKLEEVEKHIKEKKHLPEIASAKEMEKDGVNVGEFQIKLLQKIEELTLYTIEQNKLNKEQQEKIEKLTLHTIEQNKQIKELKSKINKNNP